MKNSYQELHRVTISGIASGLEAKDIGSIIYKFKDNDSVLVDLYINKVLHLEKFPSRLLSSQQLLCQHHSNDNYYMLTRNLSTLKLGGFSKEVQYNPMTNLPLLLTKSGINRMTKICNLV